MPYLDSSLKWSFFYIACIRGDEKKVKHCLKNGKSANLQENGIPVVCATTACDKPRILKLLHAHGANLNILDMHGHTPLCVAALYNCTNSARFLFEKKVDLNYLSAPSFITPVFAATRGNNIEMLKLLCEAGADPNICTSPSEATPAACAAAKGHLECLAILRDTKADLEKPDSRGRTPVFQTALYNRPEALLFLRDAKVNMTTCSISGMSPFEAAIEKEHVACMAIFTEMFSAPADVVVEPKLKKAVDLTPECVNCGDSSAPLQACSRCKTVVYCGKGCQTQHWKTGNHKKFCVAIADRVPSKSNLSAETETGVETCSICLDPLFTKPTSKLAHCSHVFHEECLQSVAEYSTVKGCPICRA